MIIIISITIVTHLDCLLRSSTLQGGGREPGNESAQPALGNDTSNTHTRAQTFTRARVTIESREQILKFKGLLIGKTVDGCFLPIIF